MVGISFLIDLDFQMLLSFCVMAPVAMRLLRSKQEVPVRRFEVLDYSELAVFDTNLHFFRPSGNRPWRHHDPDSHRQLAARVRILL